MALEAQSVADAVEKATAQHLREMRRLLTAAGKNLADDGVLHTVNMSFHRQVALASGNAVLVQLLDVLRDLFAEEQRLILKIFGSRKRDHEGHLAILEALERRDAALGVKRMRAHLKGVEDAILRWKPERTSSGDRA
jgi:GntR family transcriptional repressor for pyruvate dehydrogenase complex